MSFTDKKTVLTMGKITGPLPNDTVARLASKALSGLDDIKDDQIVGFSGWRHLRAPINESEAVCGGHLYFQLVTAAKRINSSMLKDEIKRQEIAFIANNDGVYLSSKERKRIKQEVKERMMLNAPVCLRGTEIAIDMTNGNVYVATTSQKEIDAIVALFHMATECEIIPQGINVFQEDIEPLSIAPKDKSYLLPPIATPLDFLTWMWFFSEEQGGKIEGGIESMVEGPISMISEMSDVKGSAAITVKKGNFPQVSSEAKAALLIGKKLQKCKLTITQNSNVYSGMFDADKLGFSGLSLPESESMTKQDRFVDNLESLNGLKGIIESYICTFYGAIESQGTRDLIRAWATGREAF